jgi:hypothetical protein
MKKLSNKSIDKLTSKILKETLEEKADNLVSKIQNLQELGGMEDEHDIFGEMTPEQLDFIGKLNDDELRTFLAQKRKGAEESDDEFELEYGDTEGDSDEFSGYRGDEDYEEEDEYEEEEDLGALVASSGQWGSSFVDRPGSGQLDRRIGAGRTF